MQYVVLIALHEDNLSGIVDVARQVVDAGWLVMANEAVAEVLKQIAIPVVRVEVYGPPADQDGVLCATLGDVSIGEQPHSIGSMISGNPQDPTHRSILETCGTPSIELVITNLDPPPLAGEGYIDDLEELAQSNTWGFHVRLLDAAMRDWRHVASIVDPCDYPKVARVLSRELTLDNRCYLRNKASDHVGAFNERVYFQSEGGPRHGEE